MSGGLWEAGYERLTELARVVVCERRVGAVAADGGDVEYAPAVSGRVDRLEELECLRTR